MTPLTITTAEVAELIGKSQSTAWRLLQRLVAEGLKRKGNGCGTCYDRGQFFKLWNQLDTQE